jgi:hypothetical protein
MSLSRFEDHLLSHPRDPVHRAPGSMQPFYSHLLISSTHLNQLTGLMILMTKAGFAVPHRLFFSGLHAYCIFLFCHLNLRVLPTPLLVTVVCNFFIVFFSPLASRVSKTDELIPWPGLHRSKQTVLFPFAWYL